MSALHQESLSEPERPACGAVTLEGDWAACTPEPLAVSCKKCLAALLTRNFGLGRAQAREALPLFLNFARLLRALRSYRQDPHGLGAVEAVEQALGAFDRQPGRPLSSNSDSELVCRWREARAKLTAP